MGEAPTPLLVDNPAEHAGVRLLTLNRPEKKNALSPELVNALTAALVDADRDREVRAIVLTGAGDPHSKGSAFCAGGDLGGGPRGDGFFEQHQERGAFAELLLQFRRMSKPVVAAVNGIAMGGGFGLVLACDLAVVADDCVMGTPEIKRGLFPMMIAALMYEQLPRKQANELALLGGTVGGARAVQLGIVNHVVARVDVVKEAFAYADQIAAFSPSVMQLGKRAIAQQHDMPFEQKLMFLRDQLTLNVHLEDAAEGITAFLQKREAKWSGR